MQQSVASKYTTTDAASASLFILYNTKGKQQGKAHQSKEEEEESRSQFCLSSRSVSSSLDIVYSSSANTVARLSLLLYVSPPSNSLIFFFNILFRKNSFDT